MRSSPYRRRGKVPHSLERIFNFHTSGHSYRFYGGQGKNEVVKSEGLDFQPTNTMSSVSSDTSGYNFEGMIVIMNKDVTPGSVWEREISARASSYIPMKTFPFNRTFVFSSGAVWGSEVFLTLGSLQPAVTHDLAAELSKIAKFFASTARQLCDGNLIRANSIGFKLALYAGSLSTAPALFTKSVSQVSGTTILGTPIQQGLQEYLYTLKFTADWEFEAPVVPAPSLISPPLFSETKWDCSYGKGTTVAAPQMPNLFAPQGAQAQQGWPTFGTQGTQQGWPFTASPAAAPAVTPVVAAPAAPQAQQGWTFGTSQAQGVQAQQGWPAFGTQGQSTQGQQSQAFKW